MERLKENMDYQNIVLCKHCGTNILYHVTDIKGVSDDKYIICPKCSERVILSLEKLK